MKGEKEEIEFLCANSNFPDFRETLGKHERLYSRLKGKRGLLVYRQNFSGRGLKQYSIAVILLNPRLKRYALRQASDIGLPVDCVDNYNDTVSARFIDDVREGRLEYLMTQRGQLDHLIEGVLNGRSPQGRCG
jgi:hypothetical protein